MASLLFLFLLAIPSIRGGLLTRRELTGNDHPEAFCNDGTRPAYYHSQDKEGATGVVIFFQGGLHCTDKESCQRRCQTSSPSLCTTSSRPTLGESRRRGIMSDDPAENPAFHDYYKVYFAYCTSDMYAGNRSASPETGGYQFRGRAVVRGVITSLLASSPLANASRVMLVGASAGARGVAFNCENVGAMLREDVDFRCLVDSSMYYPNISTFTPQCQYFNDLVATGNDFWYAGLDGFDVNTWWYEFTRPLMIGYMTHDDYGLIYYCVDKNDPAQMRTWGDAITNLAPVLVEKAPGVSLYMPACKGHVMADKPFYYTEVETGPQRLKHMEVIQNWVSGEGPIHAWDDCRDHGSPTCNSFCGTMDNGSAGANNLSAIFSFTVFVALLHLAVM